LEAFIEKVNKESQKLFDSTIEIVRSHFGEIFRKLFNGGKADIVVEKEEGVEPLEQGVEILARLPKKEVTKLSLMSGGEKSLTALALTLALFKTKPTAFCILDEVDAALDETNVQKFAALVKEYSQETQFIVITHNKRTMMVADRMHGITMQPPGITRKISVNFDKGTPAHQPAAG
jgi:chromosome segregation protein